MSWAVKTELTHRCEVVHLFLSLKTCYWEWAEAFSDAVWSHNSNISFYPLQIWQPKTLWHILIWWEGTGPDWGLQVTVVFFPPPFSAAQQTKHEEVALPLSFPSSKPGMKQEGRVFSYWELVYSGTSKSVGWMPLFERAPWGKQPPGLVQRWQSNNSSRGVFWVLCSIRKQAAWIGLSWQLGWVRKRLKWMEGNGRRNKKERVGLSLRAPVDS